MSATVFTFFCKERRSCKKKSSVFKSALSIIVYLAVTWRFKIEEVHVSLEGPQYLPEVIVLRRHNLSKDREAVLFAGQLLLLLLFQLWMLLLLPSVINLNSLHHVANQIDLVGGEM